MPFFFPFFFTNKNEKDAHIQYHCKTVLLVFKPATVQPSCLQSPKHECIFIVRATQWDVI